jgi:hypothetical protein
MASASKPNTPNLEGAAAAAALWTDAYWRPSHNSPWTNGKWQIPSRNSLTLAQARSVLILKVLPRCTRTTPASQASLDAITTSRGSPRLLRARPLIALEPWWMAAGASRRQPLLLGRSSPLRKTSSCCPSATASDGISEYGSALRLGAMLDPVTRASGVVVNLMLLTSVHTTTRDEYNRAWSRSSDALRAVRKRRTQTFDAVHSTVLDLH